MDTVFQLQGMEKKRSKLSNVPFKQVRLSGTNHFSSQFIEKQVVIRSDLDWATMCPDRREDGFHFGGVAGKLAITTFNF